MNIPAKWTKAVFHKTNKAHEELTQRRHGLDLKARRVLIMIDGVRSLGSLTSVMSAEELHAVILELREAGFITHETPAAAAPQPQEAIKPIAMTTSQASGTTLDPVKLTRVKAYLIETSQQHLGLMAAKLQQEIAQANDEGALRSALAHWNMALRESRSGTTRASEYMQTARTMLGWQSN